MNKLKCNKCGTEEKVAPWNLLCVKCNILLVKQSKGMCKYGGE